MSQSKLGSATESVVNIIVGYAISVLANLYVLPYFGYHITLHDSIVIGIIFTLISFVRSYTLRRIFNLFDFRMYNK